MKIKSNKAGFFRGQTAILFALALPTLLGAIGMCTDTMLMYVNWEYLQKGVDAAALAGATYLPYDSADAIATANAYAQSNGLLGSEVTPTVSADDSTITVSASRTVPYFFGRALGMTTQKISVSSSASATTSGLTCIGCTNPNGTLGSYTGQFPLEPIGLDSNTTYTLGESLILHHGGVGAGNWDTVALGGTGGANLRVRMADGYSGPISIGDSINTEPGVKIGPVVQGLNDRIAASPSGSYSYSYHLPTDPRILFLPMVDWSSLPSGRTAIPVVGFAAVWLDSVSGGGDINVHFIEAIAPDSLTNSNTPSNGVLAPPVLLQ